KFEFHVYCYFCVESVRYGPECNTSHSSHALRELVGHPEVTLVRESDCGPLDVEAIKAAARNRWIAVVFISVQSVFHCRFRKVSEGRRIQYGTLVQFPYLLTHPEVRFPVQDLMEAC